jgi:putative ABC transport system ATP-binding protein
VCDAGRRISWLERRFSTGDEDATDEREPVTHRLDKLAPCLPFAIPLAAHFRITARKVFRRAAANARRAQALRERALRALGLSGNCGELGSGMCLAQAVGVAATIQDPVPGQASVQTVLSCRGLRKVYRMGEVDVRALDGVDFELHSRELLVLLGPSGSGKSTLLNILGGLDVPSEGQVFYRDQELSLAGEDELTEYRRHHVGFVFQFYNLIPSLTARENVELVTDIADDPLEPGDALDLVGLGERLDHFPAQLSGGEQQRVAIARAIAKRPSILLCDEPTGALDFRTGILVLEVLERVNRELGSATAVITHNAPIADIADRVVSLADGRIHSERRDGRRLRASDLRW